MRAKGYRYSAEAMASGGTVSTLELLAPVWVLLGLGLLLALVVCQERGFFFKRQENRGGIFRPMYNVGGGAWADPTLAPAAEISPILRILTAQPAPDIIKRPTEVGKSRAAEACVLRNLR